MLSLDAFASTVLPILAIAFVAVIAAINLFINVRKRFPIGVNCWFCNTDTRVPYNDHNSWVCPSCTQYNGFTEDGDYNREIPAQYQCKLNPRSNITDDDKISYSTPHNVLCFGCNRNQELKIHQLASFVPDVEENYDQEVEEYQRQLEQTYKLCSRCERVVKRTLNDVKRNILGSKLAQIGTKGLRVFDLHMQASEKQKAFQKHQTVAKVCVWAIVVILVLKIGQLVIQFDFSKDSLESIFGTSASQTILIAVSYLVAFKQTIVTQWNYAWQQPSIMDGVNHLKTMKTIVLQHWNRKLDISDAICEVLQETPELMVQANALPNMALIALAGMLFCVKSQVNYAKPVLLMLCCVAEMVLKTDYGMVLIGKHTSPVILEVFLSTIALMTAIGCMGQTAPKINTSDNLNSSFHKIYSQQTNDCDYPDTLDDSIDDISTCSRKAFPQQNTSATNMSSKSLDTTKSFSPSVLTASTMRPFLDCSFSSVTSPKSRFGGSVSSVNRLNTTMQAYPSIHNFNQIGPDNSLTKTPSFSVDNFTTAFPPKKDAVLNGHAFNKYAYSTNSINKSVLPEEDQFGEDIDRLSISGRMSSVSRRDLSMVNNPFTTHHVDHDETFTLRQRKVTLSPPHLGTVAESGGSWIAGGYWGMSPQKNTDCGEISDRAPQLSHPYMSRTSSQSSGFESQPTRRPSPEQQLGVELDRVSLFSEPVGAFTSTADSVASFQQQANSRLNQTLNFPVSQSSSPAPSHASYFSRPSSNFASNNTSRSLFAERNLFQAPLASPHSSSSTAGHSAGFFNNTLRSNVFPPQQSQTPVFGGSSNLFQSNLSGQSNASRRSLLNLSKLNELPPKHPLEQHHTDDGC